MNKSCDTHTHDVLLKHTQRFHSDEVLLLRESIVIVHPVITGPTSWPMVPEIWKMSTVKDIITIKRDENMVNDKANKFSNLLSVYLQSQ